MDSKKHLFQFVDLQLLFVSFLIFGQYVINIICSLTKFLSEFHRKQRKEKIKKEKQNNNQIKRESKHFELENEAGQLGIKILTRSSTDFPLAYKDKNLLKK